MSVFKFDRIAILLVLLIAFNPTAECAQPAVSSHSNPNVIFFLTDDLGYSDISCYGTKKVITPNIDALAAAGVKFTDFHTGASICSPSRAAFLTGAYPQRCGLHMGINENREEHWFLGLHPDELTLAEQFKKQNYQTFMIGKWHLGSEPEFHPLKQGFDQYYGMPSNASHSPKFFDGEKELYAKAPLNQLTRLYTQQAVEIIHRQESQPFFLYFAHNYPHTPYQAAKEFVGTSKDGMRGDVIQELDWGFGEMMKALDDAGIADNTIVIFSSDNGPVKSEYAAPFRGTKYVTFEGGHCVPFIFHWPALIKQGFESETPIVAMDVFPTLSEIIGAPLPTDRKFDGVSLVPLLKGEALARRETEPFYYYNCENLQAIRRGDWKVHLPRSQEQVPFWEKNKAFFNLTKPVLYNLRDDLAESEDVAEENTEIVQQMLLTAQNIRKELGEYMQRGSGQRATGSAIAHAPIISTGKDWKTVDTATQAAIQAERLKRHPISGPAVQRKENQKKRQAIPPKNQESGQ